MWWGVQTTAMVPGYSSVLLPWLPSTESRSTGTLMVGCARGPSKCCGNVGCDLNNACRVQSALFALYASASLSRRFLVLFVCRSVQAAKGWR